MRLALIGIGLAAIAAVLYVASPFWAAWGLREAVRSKDTAYLERKVEWDSVRASLKESLAKHAQLVPEIADTEEAIKPGFWQRIKIAFGQSMIDSFVERYVTPTGLPELFEARKAISTRVRREPADPDQGLSTMERFKGFWSRLKRAELTSLTVMEMEIEDRRDPKRHYVSIFTLRGFEWKLTGLRVKAAPAAAAKASPIPIGKEAMAVPAATR